MYVGLIVAQIVYVYKFIVELIHLVSTASALKETEVLLIVLGLVDGGKFAAHGDCRWL